MKNFLSAVLALAMLAVPVGSMFCFADGGKDNVEPNPLDIVKVRTGRSIDERLAIVADMDFEGNFKAKIGTDNLDGRYFNMRKIRKKTLLHDNTGEYLRGLGILEEIRRLNCERATVLIVYGRFAFANFFDKDGKLVQSYMY